MTPKDIHDNAKLLKKLERYATPVIGVMGIGAGSVLLGFAGLFHVIDYPRLMVVGTILTGAIFLTTGVTCFVGAKVKEREAEKAALKLAREREMKEAAKEARRLKAASSATGDSGARKSEPRALQAKAQSHEGK